MKMEMLEPAFLARNHKCFKIINFLTVPKFIITPTVSQFQELFTFPFGPILENTIIGQQN